jgi:sigma-B regulation protein RsbU (phosphoserine phosphatase)
MNAANAAELVVNTALATLFVIVGVLSLAAARRWDAARRPGLLLAWAMLQHALNQTLGFASMRSVLGLQAPVWMWVSLVSGYLIAVPWALLVEQLVGRGWHSTIRLTWQVYLGYGLFAIAFDAIRHDPGAAATSAQFVVAAGAVVGFVNILPLSIGPSHSLRVLMFGYLAFMVFVIHDTLARAGALPWQRGTGAAGLLIFVTSLAYTVVSRTLAGQRELQAIEHELATAKRIQASLLPAAAPPLDGASIDFRYVPAAAVAGDLFEFLNPSATSVGVLVADVSGHGVPAALIASMVKVAAAAQKSHADDPSRVLGGVHLALARDLPRGQFVTAVYVYIDLERRMARHASAGHPPALLYRASDRSVTPIGGSGPLIISFAGTEYPVVEVPLCDNDRIVLYTDGIVEAMRADDEMFGVERLFTVVASAGDGTSSVASAAIDAVMRFRGRSDATFADDCTIVTIQIGRANRSVANAPPR